MSENKNIIETTSLTGRVPAHEAPMAFPLTKPQEVFGMLAFNGMAKTLDDMDQAVLAEASRSHKDV
ncbi:hypothetical protein ASF29_07445 [Rhizobium sp. Leaf262]|nr:hypothetical protein ASF29_07445 [Rhizobium sp. Leaf262]